MTNETRIAIGEGGRGLEVGLVLEDKDASEKLKIQTKSLIAQSDSENDSQSNPPPNSDPLKTKNDWGEMRDMLRETRISYTYHNGRIRLLPEDQNEPLPNCDNGITDYE